MLTLLVEDDETKRARVRGRLESLVPMGRVLEARSLNTAIGYLVTQRVDILILDMTIPTFDVSVDEAGGPPQAFGGWEILKQMDARDIIVPTVVVTQFSSFGDGHEALTAAQLDARLRADYGDYYKAMVIYDATSESWYEPFAECVGTLLEMIAREK